MERAAQDRQYTYMTETPVQRLIVKLSIPTVISMLVTNIYNLADTAFVGQFGNSASGAVGVVFGYMAIIQAIGFMFGQGGGSIVSRLLGAKDTAQATKTASTAFFCSLFCCFLVSLLSALFLDPLVMALGSTETIAPYAKTYIRYILVAAPFMASSFTLNNLLRYEGKAALGMVGMMTGAVLNMIGDPVLMFGFGMGIAGAGLSTCIGQIVSFAILLSMFLRGKTICRLSISEFLFRVPAVMNIVATGVPSLLRQGLGSAATILLNAQASVYGDEAIAAMSIVSRISFFVFSVAVGIGQGFQPVSGFNYGAGKYMRVRKGFHFTTRMAEGVVIVGASLIFVFAGRFIGIFRDDATVIEIGTRALRLNAASLLFLPLSMVTEMLFQSTGRRMGAVILSALRSGVLFIPALLILAHFRGLYGIEEAQPLAYVLAFVPSVIFAVHFLRTMPKTDQA